MNQGSSTVSVIDTATNTVEAATLTVGFQPAAVAVTPDGKHAYVANQAATSVSVIDTATNTVEAATLTVGSNPRGVGIVPPPQGIPFASFKAKLAIEFGKTPNTDAFELLSEFTLGLKSNGINPPKEPVTLKVGTFTTTIPAGSFKGSGFGPFYFLGAVGGVNLEVLILPTGAKRYAFLAAAQKANLSRTVNAVPVTLTIGDDTGMTSVNAVVFGSLAARTN